MAGNRKRILLITPGIKAEIAAMIERARAATIPVAVSMAMKVPDKPIVELKDRKPDAPPRPPPQCILIPHGFQVAFSFEEQPAGIVRHMSVALDDNPEGLPMPAAVEMIAREFGFRDFPPELIWVEEFSPGRFAINVAESTEPKPRLPTRQ